MVKITEIPLDQTIANDGQYASGVDTSSMKRKYEEQTDSAPPPPRRATGFSAPINASYPAVADLGQSAPVTDEIQIAKQKAQEIAARIFSNASSVEAKRPRVDNNGAGAGPVAGGAHYNYNDSGYGSGPTDYGQQQSMSIPAYGGYQGGGSSTKKLQIPNGRVGVIIGKGGETIKNLQHQSGAKIQITRDADADPHAQTRAVDLTGDADQIAKAEQLINEVLSAAEMGGSGQGPRRGPGRSGSGGDQFVMKIPNNKVGLVIGKGGETIKNMQATTGARIQVIPLHLPPGDTSLERTLQIDGTNEQIEAAKLLVFEVTSENRPRNSSMGGGYSQQGYQARPQTNWSQQGPPMQQYGYGQPQYQQQPYGAYPNQPTSGGYAANQSSEGSGYDYYNQQPSTQQQPSQAAPGSTDTTGYNYSQQQQATGYTQQSQGYSQDGYSNSGYQAPVPQSGYSQPLSHGYDQQGYNYSYGTQGDTAQAPPTGPPSAVPQQGYTTQQPGQNYGVPPTPTTLTGYGTQQSGYGTGYGAPPPTAQKSPAGQSAYGQTQQSPTAQGAYGQPTYPSYAQPGSTTKQSPSSLTTPPAQPGYGVPPSYVASGYAQQAPPYNSGYGGGYAQPPAYSANATPGGTTQNAAAPKASPQS